MTFYMELPMTTIYKNEVDKAIQTRMNHHKELKLNPGPITVDNPSVLQQGTLMDTATHFYMKFLAASSEQFLEFFIESEVELFRRRLKLLNKYCVRRHLEKAVVEARTAMEMYRKEETLKVLDLILNTLIRMLERCAHTFVNDHQRDCEKFTLEMHFTQCLKLVAKRAVELNRGVATVYCGLWGDVLTEYFERFLRLSVKDMANSEVVPAVRQDPRIWHPLLGIKYQLNIDVPRGAGTLTVGNLPEKSEFFPLCMKNAYLLLIRRHRLFHEARRAFTLFLKDAGMSVQCAIAFWASEYSKEAHASASCTHSWQRDYKKLRYSIRHMYGLEGSRIKYTSFSCNTLESKEAEMRCEVMCPFVERNVGHLERTVPEAVKLRHPTLLEDLRATPPLSAKGRCHLYQRACHGCDEEKTFESPIGYYRCSLAESW